MTRPHLACHMTHRASCHTQLPTYQPSKPHHYFTSHPSPPYNPLHHYIPIQKPSIHEAFKCVGKLKAAPSLPLSDHLPVNFPSLLHRLAQSRASSHFEQPDRAQCGTGSGIDGGCYWRFLSKVYTCAIYQGRFAGQCTFFGEALNRCDRLTDLV